MKIKYTNFGYNHLPQMKQMQYHSKCNFLLSKVVFTKGRFIMLRLRLVGAPDS